MGALDTDWIEANALLALLREDEEEAERVLKEMLPGELAGLAQACGILASMARRERSIQKACAPREEDATDA